MDIWELQSLSYPPEFLDDQEYLNTLFHVCRETSQIVKSSKSSIIKGYAIAFYINEPDMEADALSEFANLKSVKVKGGEDDVLFIYNVCVHPEFRCEGIGRMLVHYIKKQPCKRIIGVAIPGSHGFWHKMGAVFTGETLFTGDVFELSKN